MGKERETSATRWLKKRKKETSYDKRTAYFKINIISQYKMAARNLHKLYLFGHLPPIDRQQEGLAICSVQAPYVIQKLYDTEFEITWVLIPATAFVILEKW